MTESSTSATNSWPEKAAFPDARSALPKIEPMFATWWPEPGAAQHWVVAVAGGVGLLAALLIPGAPRPGINLVFCAVAAAAPVGLLAYERGRTAGRRRPIGRVSVMLALIALGLAAVSAVRASEWLVWGCAAAALCLGAAIALDVRRWPAVLATVPLFGVAVARALPWAGRAVRTGGLPSLSRPWLNGLGIGGACTIVVAGLLASADEAFAGLVSALWPSVDLDLLPARALFFVFASGTVLAAMFAVSTRLALPWPATGTRQTGRHPAEWLIPLVLVAVTIAAFLVVEATMLFGGAEVVQSDDSTSPAGRAREGFGQLTVVTLIVLVLLAWAGRAAAAGPAAHRRLMGAVGGVLLALALLLATSALRRLWLYQDVHGWTVTRLNAGAFELWVATVLIGVAVGWLLRRTDLLPRFLIGSAGLGLLLMGLAGPDALVAAADVKRFELTGEIDVDYLQALSADAVPALSRLPESKRACVLAGRPAADDPWFGWNLSRTRADALLRSHPPGEC
jgi:two-component system sensor histidine kinase BaeS